MEIYKISKKLMGSAFELGVVAKNKSEGNLLLQIGVDEIVRIENLLSEFLPNSEVSKINTSNQKIKIDSECFDLIQRAHHISKLTQGDFDITTKPLKSLYQFKNKDVDFPEKQTLKKALKRIGYQKIILNPADSSIDFTQKNMQISFAAIGKGYASDKVKMLWQKQGVVSGYINASGDLNAFGTKPSGELWRVAIANPSDKNKMLFRIPINNAAVATSGDYEQYFMHQGQKYSHNINPHTGIPLTAIKSVTVFSPSAELSDALATAVSVKGVVEGLKLVNQLPNTHVMMVDLNNKLYFSKEINYHQYAI